MNLSYALLCLYCRIDAMTNFHHPGDPYFPNQGNEGRIVEDPKEDPEEILEEESEEEVEEEVEEEEEEEEDESGMESEVIDPPYMARVHALLFTVGAIMALRPLGIRPGEMEPISGATPTFWDGARIL